MTLVYATTDECGCVRLEVAQVSTIEGAARHLTRAGAAPTQARLFHGAPISDPYEPDELHDEWLRQSEAEQERAEREQYLRLRQKFEGPGAAGG